MGLHGFQGRLGRHPIPLHATMSIVDAIFVALYFACGVALAMFLGKHFGPIYALVGFVMGFAVPMVLWRSIAPRLGRKSPLRKRREPPESPT